MEDHGSTSIFELQKGRPKSKDLWDGPFLHRGWKQRVPLVFKCAELICILELLGAGAENQVVNALQQILTKQGIVIQAEMDSQKL